jgi:hypothetical protein
MRLRLETTTRAPYWLVGDPLANARSEQSEALTETLQITRNVQAVAGAGFDTQLHFDRGQQKVAFDATCNRIFSTGLERLAFLASLAPIDLTTQRHLWEGTAWLREDSGTSFIEYALPQCVIMLTGTQLVGALGLNLTYRIQAGGFTSEREGTSLVKLLAAENIGYSIVLFGEALTGTLTNSPSPSVDTVSGFSIPSSWSLELVATYTGGPATRGPFSAAISGIPVLADALSWLASQVPNSMFAVVAITIGGRAGVKFSLDPTFAAAHPEATFELQFTAASGTMNCNASAFSSALPTTVLIASTSISLLADSID